MLNARIGGLGRQSTDIDSNLNRHWAEEHTDTQVRCDFLQKNIETAIRRSLADDDPVRYHLSKVDVKPKPRDGHPRGWDAFDVTISLEDRQRKIRGAPRLSLDIAAPETLGDAAIQPLQIGGMEVLAYSLERIAGEKMRAFLSSLPAYGRKIERAPRSVRVKDIYDLARILQLHPPTDRDFWVRAGEEFRLACMSRLIDCDGIRTFEENLETTRLSYDQDPTLPKDISFDVAWSGLTEVVVGMQQAGLLPIY